MKSYHHLYEQFISDENYYLGVKNATKRKGGKKRKYRRAQFYRDYAEEMKPYLMVYAKYFHNAEHEPKQIYDGIRRKQRKIIVPTVQEQIIHHMIVNVLKPIFMKSMYEHSYGSIPGRGAHLGKKRIEKWIRHGGKNCKYCLKMDIKKYFDSIPHDALKEKLSDLIHDRRFSKILFEIIDAVPGDRGIPIGFYTSQWFANWYLTELDHYIKQELHAIYYIRYMDDMVIFGPNKRELHEIREQIEDYLHGILGLEMKDNWQVFLFDYTKRNGTHVGRDLDFMGFRFYRDRTVLRRHLMLRMTRKAKRIYRKGKTTIYDCRQMLAYLGWLDSTDSYNIYKDHIKPYLSFRRLKRRLGVQQIRINRQQRRKLLCLSGTQVKTAV